MHDAETLDWHILAAIEHHVRLLDQLLLAQGLTSALHCALSHTVQQAGINEQQFGSSSGRVMVLCCAEAGVRQQCGRPSGGLQASQTKGSWPQEAFLDARLAAPSSNLQGVVGWWVT